MVGVDLYKRMNTEDLFLVQMVGEKVQKGGRKGESVQKNIGERNRDVQMVELMWGKVMCGWRVGDL